MTMSQEEYVKKRGLQCPNCASDQLEGDSVEIDAGIAWQKVSCLDCDSSWTDCYDLTGFNQLQVSPR